MAKARRSPSRQRMRTLQRDLTRSIARPRLLQPRIVVRSWDLRALEDRRIHQPDPRPRRPLLHRWPLRVVGPKIGIGVRPASVREAPRGRYKSAIAQLGMQFNAPKKVLVCVRRKQRREVLMAFNKGGKGARSRRRRNEWSDVKC